MQSNTSKVVSLNLALYRSKLSQQSLKRSFHLIFFKHLTLTFPLVLTDLLQDMLVVCQKIGLKFKKPDLLEFSHHKNEEFMKFEEDENDLVDVMSDETETKVLSICL